MPISESELQMCLSGGAANSNPNNSLGGTRSSVTITDNSMNNLFDDVSAAEAQAGDVEYRGFFVRNANGALTLSNAFVYISASSTAPGDEWYIGTDTAGISETMSSISNEGVAPSGVTFVGFGTTLSLGNLGPTKSYGIWAKRSVSAGASSYPNNTVIIAFGGETA